MLHVLSNVDAPAEPVLQRALNETWHNFRATKPHPELLWCFIQEDRNLILKEYEHRAGQSATVNLGSGTSTPRYRMNAGPFEGRDPRAVAEEAIEWLGRLLDDLESLVAGESDR